MIIILALAVAAGQQAVVLRRCARQEMEVPERYWVRDVDQKHNALESRQQVESRI